MRALPGPSENENESQRQRTALTIRRLANAVVDGDDGALVLLQRIGRLNPVAVADEIGGNLQDLACEALAIRAAGANLTRYINMRVHLKLTSAALAGDNPSRAMQCCASWVAIMQAHASIEAANSATEERGAHLLGTVSREYMHAVKTMAQIDALETRRPRRGRPKAKTIDAEFKIIGP
jgi:hypothetical protein